MANEDKKDFNAMLMDSKDRWQNSGETTMLLIE